MIGSFISELETPSLVIDLDKMDQNIKRMQQLADQSQVMLRPHIKTHKMAKVALEQIKQGSKGITVAKSSEAEAMANAGIDDIFIANQIIGRDQMRRIKKLSENVKLCIAVDAKEHVDALADLYNNDTNIPIEIMIEINTGQNRCGVKPGDEALELASWIHEKHANIPLRGIFTHEGMVYHAESPEELKKQSQKAQFEMVETGKRIQEKLQITCEISIGCSLSQLGGGIISGITEIRPGTYIFYDSQHANFIGHTDHCAATILATIVSRRGSEHAVADAGAKSMTIDTKDSGICKTTGFGKVKDSNALIQKLSDEHAVLTSAPGFEIGDRLEFIPNHICPTVNLYNTAYGVRDGKVEEVLEVTCRGHNR